MADWCLLRVWTLTKQYEFVSNVNALKKHGCIESIETPTLSIMTIRAMYLFDLPKIHKDNAPLQSTLGSIGPITLHC